jgi:hypothetical protein
VLLLISFLFIPVFLKVIKLNYFSGCNVNYSPPPPKGLIYGNERKYEHSYVHTHTQLDSTQKLVYGELKLYVVYCHVKNIQKHYSRHPDKIHSTIWPYNLRESGDHFHFKHGRAHACPYQWSDSCRSISLQSHSTN